MSDPAQPAPKRFDMTFNFGHVAIIATFVASLIASYTLSGYRLDALERKSDRIEAKIDVLTPIQINAAIVEQRMKDFERRLAQAEHH